MPCYSAAAAAVAEAAEGEAKQSRVTRIFTAPLTQNFTSFGVRRQKVPLVLVIIIYRRRRALLLFDVSSSSFSV